MGSIELRSRSNFRHPHDPPFSLIVQIEVLCNHVCFNHSTHIDVRSHLITSHNFFAINERLRIPISLIPWPPSLIGLHTSFHATLAYPDVELPFRRKVLSRFSICLIIAFGKMNADAIIADSTDLMICIRPAYDNEIPSQPLMRASIFKIEVVDNRI